MSVDAIFPPDPVTVEQLALPVLARKAIERGLQRRVTAHHALALSAVPKSAAAPVIKLIADAQLNVTFNPISNLFTEGRTDDSNPRRGLTRVKELWSAGVNVAYGTDNMDDTYLPYINLDLLTEGLVASVAAHMGTVDERRALVQMATYGAAKTLGIEEGYGMNVGCRADLVVLATDSIDKVLTEVPRKVAVLKGGRVVAGRLPSAQGLAIP
jgi:cytosine/creatinine deaminase